MSKLVAILAALLLVQAVVSVQINFAPSSHLQREADLPVVAEEGVEDVAPAISETSGSKNQAIVAETVPSAPPSKPAVEPTSEKPKVVE